MSAAPDSRSVRSVNPPRQARSEASLQRLLDAATALIDERGHGDLSINEVARRAGSSVGGFYARFRSKDDLLLAIEDDFFRRLRLLLDEVAVPERWRDTPAPEIVRSLVQVLVENHRRNERLILAFVARAARDPSHPPGVLAFRQLVAERLSALAAARPELIAHPEPALAAEFAVQAVFGILQSRVISGALGAPQLQLPIEALARELERLVLTYLGVTVPPTEGDSHAV